MQSKRVPTIITDEFFEIDPFETHKAIELPASKLKDGMIILDDLGCPEYLVDHRDRMNRGEVPVMMHDLNNGGYFTTKIHANRIVRVAA